MLLSILGTFHVFMLNIHSLETVQKPTFERANVIPNEPIHIMTTTLGNTKHSIWYGN